GPTHPRRRGSGEASPLAREGQERLEGGKLASGRGIADAVRAAGGELTAQIIAVEPGEGGPVHLSQNIQQPGGSCRVGPHRMRGTTTTFGEVPAPGFEYIGPIHAATNPAGTISPSSAS